MVLSVFDAQILEKVLKEKFPDRDNFSKTELILILNEMTKTEKYVKTGPGSGGQRYKVFKYFVRYCLYRNLANFDTMILLSGPKGAGKSSFGILLCREWCRLLDIRFSPKHHIAYSNQQVRERIDNLNSFSPLLCDESINFASASEWGKVENRELRKKLAQVRTRHLFFILCWPLKVNKIEKTYLDSFVNYWIHILKRGTGAIFIPDMNPVTDAWRLKLFQDIGGFTEFTGVDKIKKKLMKHPNFWYMITVPKPSEEFYSKYLVTREKNVYNTEGVLSNLSRQDIHKAIVIKFLEDLLVKESTINMRRILLHIKTTYDYDMKESEFKAILADASMLMEKLRSENYKIDSFKSETDWKNISTEQVIGDDEEASDK